MTNTHFTLTKDRTHTLGLSLVVLLAAFTGAMIPVLLMRFGTDLNNALLEGAIPRGQATMLSLSTDRTEYQAGEALTTVVRLATRFPTTGVNVVLRYDPRLLELQRPAGRAPGSYLDGSGSSFTIFPFEHLQRTAAEATFTFSALTPLLEEVRGRAIVARLTFRALRPGTATLAIVLDPTASADSDVAYHGRDILEKTNALTVTIR